MVLGTLLGVNIFFAVSVGIVYFSSRELSISHLPWRELTSSRENASAEGRPLTAYPQTLSHPIFLESRSPFIEPPPPPPPAPLPMPQTDLSYQAEPPIVSDPGLALGGILMLENTQKAYLFTENIAEGVWVAKGREILGWTVLSIDNDRGLIRQRKSSTNTHIYTVISEQIAMIRNPRI